MLTLTPTKVHQTPMREKERKVQGRDIQQRKKSMRTKQNRKERKKKVFFCQCML